MPCSKISAKASLIGQGGRIRMDDSTGSTKLSSRSNSQARGESCWEPVGGFQAAVHAWSGRRCQDPRKYCEPETIRPRPMTRLSS